MEKAICDGCIKKCKTTRGGEWCSGFLDKSEAGRKKVYHGYIKSYCFDSFYTGKNKIHFARVMTKKSVYFGDKPIRITIEEIK